MNIFFTRKQDYIINRNFETVRNEIEKMVNKKWSDFSENITGTLNKDNSFKLTHKWSFTIIKWVERDPAYLTGIISEEGMKTKLSTSLRPNSVFVIFFYLLTILFLYELFVSDTFIKGPKAFKLLFLPCFNLILFGLMQLYTNGLKNRFERLLQLKHEI